MVVAFDIFLESFPLWCLMWILCSTFTEVLCLSKRSIRGLAVAYF